MERGEIRYGVFEDIRYDLPVFALKYFAAAYREGLENDRQIFMDSCLSRVLRAI